MKMQNIQKFRELLSEDIGLNRSLVSAFASNYEHASQNSINTANEVAAEHTYYDLISDTFTEDISFETDENELKNFLIQQYGFTIAFVQSGF
jgi:hypothetical protein